MLLYKRPRTRQPPQTRPIDTGNRLCKALEMFFGWSGGQAVDSTSLAPLTVSGGSFVTSPLGIVRNNARSESMTTTELYDKVGSNVPLTTAMWVSPDNSDTSPDAMVNLGFAVSGGDVFSAYTNVIAAGDVYVSTLTNDIYSAGGLVNVGAWNSIIVSFDGKGDFSTTTCQVWINGVLIPMTGSGTVKPLNLTANQPVFIGKDAVPTREFRGKIGPVGIWSRGFSTADASQWRVNPWAVYAPLPRRLWMPAVSTPPPVSRRGGVIALLMG